MDGVRHKKSRVVLLRLAAVVLVLFAAVVFVSNYLVIYAIGRSGDGGSRTVSLEVDEASDDAQRLMAENRKLQEQLTADFRERVEEQRVQITTEGGLQLNGGYYENMGSSRWAVVIHG
ncbi:MAG: hypothetical protein LUE96_02760 [Lachnospiraceae bacterium]|nr:hypothetical protein [Lachnospiraceae bacterium]